MTPAPTSIIDDLIALIGPIAVLSEPQDMAGFLSEPRQLFFGQALCVLLPASVAEVAAILRYCNRRRIGVVPQGGNSGLVGGQIPDDSGQQVILSLTRLQKIREIDRDAAVMTVEAGVTLAQAQQAAREAQLLLPLSLASEGSATIGGLTATNAGGTAAIAYGTMKDLVQGIEVVLADGRVLPLLSKLKKDNTGYHLAPLFVGSEGTLGIITAVSLRLFPPPLVQSCAWIGLDGPKAALALLNFMRAQFGERLKSFELIARIGLDFVLRHLPGARDPLGQKHNWYVLAEFSDTHASALDAQMTAALELAAEAALIEDAAIALSLQQAQQFWAMREALSEVQKQEGGSIKHDISVPIAAIPDFLAQAAEKIESLIPGARLVAFGHLGDGNLHCNVSQPVGADKQAFLARWGDVNALIHGLVLDFGGSISAEHGIGQLKRGLLQEVKDPEAYALMQAIKSLLDPQGILNPGKVLQ